MGKKHDCVGSVVFRKWLQYPPDFGLGCLVESIVDSDVREAGLRLLRGMDYSGFAEVEFKRDGKTNELKLIEINPRPWDQHSLATRCGVNLSHAAYLDALGLKIPEYQYKNGGYWIASENLVRRIVNDVTSGRKVDLHLLWRVITGKKHYSLFSIYDPVPGLIGLFILIKDILSWIGRKLFRLR